jgi:phenylalanine-4-hydroxylase
VNEDVSQYVTVFADLNGRLEDPNIQKALAELGSNVLFVNVVGSWTIPWYPRKMADLDLFQHRVLAAGSELQDDPENPHPGFRDEEYKKRRREICENAFNYKHGQPLPTLEYTKKEVETWSVIWDRLTKLHTQHACREYNYIFPLLVENCGYSHNHIPQIRDISAYLESRTGFTLRPVAGLLSSRDFLGGLALRVFHSTQYIRHHSKPLYTPEPDVVHELMGHVPLFADPDFADFSQAIGMASLGASDEDIKKLASNYWFTVEFGMLKQGGALKAYGAGILSSFGELEYSVSGTAKELPYDPYVAAVTPYPITKFQPTYFITRNFKEMKEAMQEYASNIDRPFVVTYNPHQKSIMSSSRNTDLSGR